MWTATANDDKRLLVIKSDDVFDYRNLLSLLKQVYVDDKSKYASYDRFADLSGLEAVDLDIDTVVKTVQMHRQIKPPTKEVKVAVLIPFGMTGSLVQIYRLLTESDTLFNTQVFRSVEECAEFLLVDQSILA